MKSHNHIPQENYYILHLADSISQQSYMAGNLAGKIWLHENFFRPILQYFREAFF